MNEVSIKIQNYKCFGRQPQGFENIRPINVIIGRNNSGKSSIIDMIKYAITPFDLSDSYHKMSSDIPRVIISDIMNEQELRRVFPNNRSGGVIGGNHWDFGKNWIGKKITYSLEKDGKNRFIKLDPPLPERSIEYNQNLANVKTNPFNDLELRHLKSERYILPEDDHESGVDQYGNGATNIIQRFINKANLSSGLVELDLLSELNKIMQPDVFFEDIVVQQLKNGKWEIFLEEKNKGRISLTNSGSGLQTIILILVNTILIPAFSEKKLKDYIFAFEEIENNLHPSLQRRLFQYLKKLAIENSTIFFITTHSNIVIDLFSSDSTAQIVHVAHNGQEAKINLVKAYIDRKGVLDDLDVRASDLLQSNGVIWVEGPSDRLYLNRWIDLFSDGELKEGIHYQCVFYGGRLLAHLSINDPDESIDSLINLLMINKNVIMIIDSDKRTKQSPINDTKKRILVEMSKNDSLCWITKGREIENYIHSDIIKEYFQANKVNQIGQYQEFGDYLDSIEKNSSKKYLNNKVLFAENILPHFTKSMLSDVLDLSDMLSEVCSIIKKWNSMPT